MNLDREAIWRKVGYKPHPKQLLFHDSTARFKIPVCGRRFGKSRMAAAELLPEVMNPANKGRRYWIVGPTYALGEKEFRYLWDDIIVKLGLGPHVKRKAYNERTGEMFIEMPWGTRVEVKSADHPDGLVGEGLAGVIMSEAAKAKKLTWDKYVRPALADAKGWAVFPSTPEGFNWYFELYQRGRNPSQEDYESWNFPSWENPHVYPGGFEDPEVQGQMGTEDGTPWFWQELGADFRSFVGKIYTDWDDQRNILWGEYQYNPAWPNYNFFDFGFSNPFACLDVQVDPSDNVYVWREHYMSEMSVSKHIAHLQARSNPDGYAVACGFGDSADPGVVEMLSANWVPTYAHPDAKDVQRGIQEVKKFLAPDDQGKPRLYVHYSCVNTIFEFQNYRTQTTNRDDLNLKEDPKKWSDHAMDAIRYGIMHLYVLGARYHLEDVAVDWPSPPVAPSVRTPDLEMFERVGMFTREKQAVFTLTSRTTW